MLELLKGHLVSAPRLGACCALAAHLGASAPHHGPLSVRAACLYASHLSDPAHLEPVVILAPALGVLPPLTAKLCSKLCI